MNRAEIKAIMAGNMWPGKTVDQHKAWYAWTGDMHEAAIVRLITGQAVELAPRTYLGMSNIGYCERMMYRRFMAGDMAVVRSHQVEVVAGFDPRFRGHVDHVVGNELYEVKSQNWNGFNKTLDRGPVQAHLDQVQAYLRHGKFDTCHLVYVARDIPHWAWSGTFFEVFDVYPDESHGKALDDKAASVLAAIDRQEEPECEDGCFWCNNE